MFERIAGADPTSRTPEAETAAPLALQLLGAWDARVQGRPMRPLRSRKGQWLLALLLLQDGRAVEREWLASLLWPDSAISQALYNLRRNLTDLRDALGPEVHRLLPPSPRTLRLDLAGAEVDVLRFDAAIAAGDGASLERAVHLYRGPLLVECMEEWITPERTAREQAYLGALEALAREARAREDHEAEGRCLRRALAVDPLREGAQQALMESLAAQGDVSAAMRVYREYRELLHREASTAPSPVMTALFEQLRARSRERRLSPAGRDAGTGTGAQRSARGAGTRGGDGETERVETSPVPEVSPSPAPPSHLPVPVSSFVGREETLLEIEAALRDARLVTLTGAGGVGKTRLALQVGRQILSDYPDGVWFVELAGLAPSADAALVAQTIARVLGAGEQPGRPPLETLREFLRPKRLLLILDNCEHLLHACTPLVASLLEGAPELRVLATSRQSLGLTGEADWRVPSLSVPGVPPPARARAPTRKTVEHEHEHEQEHEASSCDALLQFEAVRLFVDRGRAAVRSFALTAQNATAVVAICRRLDGLPLALELAAARLKALMVEEIAARLDDRFRLLTGSAHAALPRHQTLRKTLDWSYDLLLEPERILWRRLSIFAGGFTLEAAATVCSDASVIPRSEVLDRLSALVDKSLVQWEVGGRYRLLETVREYAAERLRDSEEHAAIAQAHVLWAAALAKQGESALQGPEQIAWLDRLGVEIDNFRSALEWSLNGDSEGGSATGGRLAGALAPFFLRRGFVVEGRRWLERALEASPTLDDSTRAKLLAGAAALCHQQAEVEPARRFAEQCLALQRALGDRRGEGEALERLGHILNLQGEHERATALFEESLALRRAVGDRAGVASALNARGYMAWFYGDRERAVALCEESLQLWREQGDAWGTANTLEYLGMALVGKRDAAAAMRPLEECLHLRRRLGDKRGIAAALMQLGYAVLQRDDLGAAQAFFEESLPLWRELNNPDSTAVVLMGLGVVARRQGALARALALFQEGLTLFHQIAHHPGMAECLDGMARTARLMGDDRRSAYFSGLAERTLEEGKVPLTPGIRQWLEANRAAAAAALDETACAAAWQEGRAMSVEQATAAATEIATDECRRVRGARG